MIYTVTMNPSIDCNMDFQMPLQAGLVNRAQAQSFTVGGKGINVAIVLRRLGHEVTATGFLAGFTGNEVEERVIEEDVCCRFTRLSDGNTRINVKINCTEVTDINGPGPLVSEEELDDLFSQLNDMNAGDILVVSGSPPSSLPSDIYTKFAKIASERNVMFSVDAEGEQLKGILPYSPFLVKPNIHELEEMFQTSIISEDEIVRYAAKLCDMGAKNALVSLGENGAVLATAKGEAYAIPAVPVKVISPVGSGDSMVAGFIAASLNTDDPIRAIRLGCAAGSATAACEGLAARDYIEELYSITSGTVRTLISNN